MNSWLSSFDRKKHQRRVNQYVRALNKNISNDDLWRGRFIIRQVGSPNFHIYEDKSGAELYNVHLVIIDLKDGRTYDRWASGNEWCHFGGSRIWEFANYAITEVFDVWRQDDDPRKYKDYPDYDFNNHKVCKAWRKEWQI